MSIGGALKESTSGHRERVERPSAQEVGTKGAGAFTREKFK